NAAEDSWVDRHSGRREAPAREYLRLQAASGVADERWLLFQRLDDLRGVIGDLLQRLVGQDLGFRPGDLDRLRVIWPVRRERDVAGVFEDLGPVVPARGQ